MDHIVDSAGQLAHCLKAERLAHQWSIADLAERSGVSKAMISKIERGDVSPTAALLARLGNAFGLTLSALFARAEQSGSRLNRAQDRKSWVDPESGYLRRQVLGLDPFPLDIVEIEMPPGARACFPAASYAFQHHAIWLREGSLAIREGDLETLLHPGDCLALGAAAEVCFYNPGPRPCHYAVVIGRMGGFRS